MTDFDSLQEPAKTLSRRRKYRWIFGLSTFTILLLFVLFRFDVVGGALGSILRIFNPLFYGIAAAYIISPLSDIFFALLIKISGKNCPSWLKTCWKTLSILLGTAVFLGAIAILLILILPQLYNAVLQLIERAPSYLDSAEKWYQNFVDPEKEWTVTLGNYIASTLNSLESWLTERLPQLMNTLLSYITSGVLSLLSFLIDFFIGLVLAVYIIKEKRRIFAQFKKLIYAMFPPKRSAFVLDMARHGKTIFNQYVYSNLLGCVIVFLTTLTFMLITKMPYALLVSILVGVTNFIPFFGPFIGAIPSAFLLLFIRPVYALYFILFSIVIQQLEGNVITPLIVSERIGLSPLWVTVAIIIGEGLFGLAGLLLAVPVFAVLYYFVKRIINNKLEQKNLSSDTTAYMGTSKNFVEKFRQSALQNKRSKKSASQK